MDLIEEYLKAVAALLPRSQREDIVAELRDIILTRKEEREAALGRALMEGEIEALLREVGHPVVVAARYGEGPQHVVGPMLYPYWLFAVKAVLVIQAVVAGVVFLVSSLAYGDVGYGFARALAVGVTGAATLIGFATARRLADRAPPHSHRLSRQLARAGPARLHPGRRGARRRLRRMGRGVSRASRLRKAGRAA